MDMEPTYFLYSGRLFHAVALEMLSKARSNGPAAEGRHWGASPDEQSVSDEAQPDDEGRVRDDREHTDRVDVEEGAATLRDPFCNLDADGDRSDADSCGHRDAIEPR